LCEAIDATPVSKTIELTRFSQAEQLADVDANQRLAAAIKVLLQLNQDEKAIGKIDRVLLDSYINQIDQVLGQQLDEILHDKCFQQLESTWTGLKYLVDRTDSKANSRIDLLDATKEQLNDDFQDAPEITQSGLYKHLYIQEYDTPGGEPYASMVSNYEFDSSNQDIGLLHNISKVASSAHCPFLGSVGSTFFHKISLDEVMKIEDISNYMERAEFMKWNGFRDSEDARYVGLTFPRFLLRLPYGDDNPVKSFQYHEQANARDHEKFLWGSAAFALAANMAASFKHNGWLVNIRGPQAGGKVENLLLHQFDAGRGLQTKIPSEALISETRELEFANLGFIPLSYYKNSDYACFFSANSAQRPQLYNTKEATANSRINTRLPYIFLASRIGHYLKVLQRENIGAAKDKNVLSRELNEWLRTLVTEMDGSNPDVIARYPLREGSVIVEEMEDNLGYYRMSLMVKPHFQIEGIDVKLSLVGKMPAAGDK
jgi:type VI secretion system protein ImpC